MARLSGAAALVNALARDLARRIRTGGPLSIESYMAAALGHPQHGYYTTRDPFGVHGDFVTAPEVSQMFGELVGLWCVELWQRLGAPAPVILAELGPGRGTLMRDMLRAARVVPAFAAACRVHLVETSPVLRAAQAQTLGAGIAGWHDTLETVPPGPLLLVANEFLDALPIRQLVRAADGWHERRVGLSPEGRLVFTVDPAPSTDAEILQAMVDAAVPGALVELRPAAAQLARVLARRLASQGGAALFIDYGHATSGVGDTLQAVRRHAHHPVLENPGEADLTAQVDFAAFCAAAREGGARVYGPLSQGAWLAALGIAQRAARLCAAAPARAAAISSALRRLIHPAAMGALFKVVALADPAAPAPDGFAP